MLSSSDSEAALWTFKVESYVRACHLDYSTTRQSPLRKSELFGAFTRPIINKEERRLYEIFFFSWISDDLITSIV